MPRSIPRVTSILSGAGLIDATWFTAAARDAGTALHSATQYLDEGALNWDTVDPVIYPRLRQYQRFKDELNPRILAIEEVVENEIFGYCGHLDRRMIIGSREGVVDIKPMTKAPWQAIQVAAYAACFRRPLARWTLHINDERYQLVEHKDRRDWEVFKAAMTIAAWRERCQAIS